MALVRRTPIHVHDNFEVMRKVQQGGLFGGERDVLHKLFEKTPTLNFEKMRQIYGVSAVNFGWKRHPYFRKFVVRPTETHQDIIHPLPQLILRRRDNAFNIIPNVKRSPHINSPWTIKIEGLMLGYINAEFTFSKKQSMKLRFRVQLNATLDKLDERGNEYLAVIIYLHDTVDRGIYSVSRYIYDATLQNVELIKGCVGLPNHPDVPEPEGDGDMIRQYGLPRRFYIDFLDTPDDKFDIMKIEIFTGGDIDGNIELTPIFT
jgi:hypothetical protein